VVSKLEDNVEVVNKLSELSIRILDCFLNVPSIYNQENVFETVLMDAQEKRDALEAEWNVLFDKNIVVKKDYSFLIEPLYLEKIKERVRGFLDDKGITVDNILSSLEKGIKENKADLASLIKMLGKVYGTDQNRSVSFSDYDWDTQQIQFCDQLVKMHFLFKKSTSSRKHAYLNYYFRQWPFRGEELIENLIMKHLNISGLHEQDWKIICLLLMSDRLELKYQILKNNLDFTDPQLRELITNLRDRGLIDERAGNVHLQQGLRESLAQYFKANIYPSMMSRTITRLKEVISTALSNLWLFLTVKRISELPIGESKSDPFSFKVIRKSDLKEYETQFVDMERLNLITDFEDQILIPQDILKDTENWLKSSIKKTVSFIPARDYYLARETLQKIFSSCEDYVKIQDPYLGEETFYVLEYIPKDLEVRLLTGIRVGTGEEAERIAQQIERFTSERRGTFYISFIGNVNGDAPFHDRFIISKNSCWQSGTSLKEIGRGKDTTVVEIPKQEKDEMIEQAFDRLWEAKGKVLEERGLKRINFKEWLNTLRKTLE